MSKTRVTMTPNAITENWKQRMTGSVKKMQDAVNAVNESPMEKAAANIEKQVQGVIEAAASGRTQAALRAVSLADWKTKTVAKIGERMSGGVNAATNKMNQFNTWLVDRLNTVLPTIASMASGTFADSKARVNAYMDAMHDQPYKS